MRGPQSLFVAVLWAVSVGLSVTTLRWTGDWAAAGVAAILVALFAAYAVAAFGKVNARWSAAGFVHLAFAYAVGPPAILALAAGQALGSTARRRAGPIRTLFNAADHFLSDVAAWATFLALTRGDPPVLLIVLAGAVGALAHTLVNHSLVAIVSSLAGEGSPLDRWLASLLKTMAMIAPFSVSAAIASILYRSLGIFGVIVVLLPIAVVQLSMVALSRKAYEKELLEEVQAREREEQARQRAALLQRAANASERERSKLAADLHDGVIQDMTALTMRLGANGNRLGDEDPRLSGLLMGLSESGNRIIRDLRAMMIELAPPELEKHGIRAALEQLLAKLDRDSIIGHLDCPDLDLDPQRLRLVHRVVREAMRNAVKHSQCHNFWVSVRLDGDTVTATARDDGRGFSEEERAQRRAEDHNGLGLLEQTVIDGGGRLAIASEPGVGTTMTLFAGPPPKDPFAEAGTEPADRVPQAPPPALQTGGDERRGTRAPGIATAAADHPQPAMATARIPARPPAA